MINNHKSYGIYEKIFKRLLDFVCALIVIIFFWWLYVIIAILVCIKLGTPVLFVQERPGRNEEIFKLYKFRTMTNKRDEKGELLPDDVRLTNFGKWLRSTSLDELPELLNILKGDMSLVGPRPLAAIYLDYYTDEEHMRHSVRPGLTGLAQINGRNSISWEEKFSYDLQYISKITFIGDIRILWKTVGKVFKRESIGQAEQAPLSLHIERSKERKT